MMAAHKRCAGTEPNWKILISTIISETGGKWILMVIAPNLKPARILLAFIV
jgi:hypothetical protein